MKVLIVDDNEESRYMLESLLTGCGHAVQSAENGKKAIEILKSGGFNLIISDILMPVMDGFQLCRTVKTDEDLRTIPFIFYTATYTGPQDESFALKIGANRFIIKPCDPDVFLKAVDEVMEEAEDRKGGLIPEPVEEKEVLKLYNERIVRKLEKKMLEAEREILARRSAEKELLKSRERLIEAQRIAKMGDFKWDIETGEVTLSDGLFDLLGYEISEHIDYARVNAEIHHPDDLAFITQWHKESMSSGRINHGPREYRLIKKDGETIYGQVFISIRYENSRPVEMLGTVQDITERRLAEDALKKSEERYRVLVENAGEVIMVAQDGITRFVNHTVFSRLGYRPEEMVGRPFADYINPEDRDAVAERHAKRSKGDDVPSVYPFRVVNKAGQTRWVEINSVLTEWEGSPATLNFLEDITESKDAREEQERLQAQLYQAQKLESIGRLAGGVAHDFNNMLSVILGFGDIVLSKLDPLDPLSEDVKEIVNAGKRSAALTRQLLAFSRKQTLQPEIVNINAVLKSMEKMVRRIIGEDILLELSLFENLCQAMVDPGQIEQVVMNLAVNARDAMPHGGSLIIETANVEIDEAYAETHKGAEPGKYVMLAVTDNGCGMDEQTLSQIFEPFFTTKEKGKGTGLGLSTVYGIVKQSGGDVRVYSEPGKGTTFKIYFPQTSVKKEQDKPQADRIKSGGCGEHILVVEDEDGLRRLINTLLSGMGYKVTVAANGVEALLLIDEKKLRPDLVITDVVMPGLSGAMLAERLRMRLPGLKVLYMSGYADDIIAHHGILFPGAPFMKKPFTGMELSEKVRSVLGVPARNQ